MNILTLDVETTTWNKGNPFDKRNILVMSGFKFMTDSPMCLSHLEGDSRELLAQFIQEDYIDQADIIVGFNIKFDIHWLINVGVSFANVKQIWDCQIAEFLLESQGNKYPSLNEALDKYALPRKLDVVNTEYWDKGVNTDEIPKQILRDYLEGDLMGTEEVFKRQWQQFTGTLL